MNGAPASLQSAYRLARLAGYGMCLGTPLVLATLMGTGFIAPGGNRPEGPFLQLGHAFSGLAFLSAAWVLWRRGAVLRRFREVPDSRRPRVLLRESLLYAALFELCSLYGLAYWLMVGRHAPRHAFGFVLLAPLLFLAFVPRLGQWCEAAGPGAAR